MPFLPLLMTVVERQSSISLSSERRAPYQQAAAIDQSMPHVVFTKHDPQHQAFSAGSACGDFSGLDRRAVGIMDTAPQRHQRRRERLDRHGTINISKQNLHTTCTTSMQLARCATAAARKGDKHQKHTNNLVSYMLNAAFRVQCITEPSSPDPTLQLPPSRPLTDRLMLLLMMLFFFCGMVSNHEKHQNKSYAG